VKTWDVILACGLGFCVAVVMLTVILVLVL
jgi:hypothetical protein